MDLWARFPVTYRRRRNCVFGKTVGYLNEGMADMCLSRWRVASPRGVQNSSFDLYYPISSSEAHIILMR